MESRRVIGGRKPESILEIVEGIIVWCEKQKFGAFVVEADRTCREVGEDDGNSEHRIP